MADDKNVQKFDPTTLMQGVKDRIKAEFVALIPDEQWNEMVKKEVKEFFLIKERTWRNKEIYSDFGEVVNNLLREECKSRVKEYLSSPEFESIWTNNGLPAASDAVKKMIVENSGELLMGLIGGIAQQAVNDLRNNLATQY